MIDATDSKAQAVHVPVLTTSYTPNTPPVCTLSPKEQAAFEQLKAQVPALAAASSDADDVQHYCTDAMLLRYLRARKWSVKAAERMLRSSLDWRASYQPHRITAADVASEAAAGNNFVHGFDKSGRPILYIIKRDRPGDFERNVRLLVWNLELACRVMPPGVETMVIVIDFSAYDRRNAPPLSISRMTLDILANHYPERMGAAYLVNPPAIFSVLWTLLSPFIDPVTRAKITFLRLTSDELSLPDKNALLQAADAEMVLPAFGGTSSYVFSAHVYEQAAAAVDKHYA